MEPAAGDEKVIIKLNNQNQRGLRGVVGHKVNTYTPFVGHKVNTYTPLPPPPLSLHWASIKTSRPIFILRVCRK